MPALDARTWIDQARRYMRLRHRYLLSFAASIVMLVAMGIGMIVCGGEISGGARTVLGSIALIGFACFGVGMFYGRALFAFRCPRCDSQFTISSMGLVWPGKCCKHCGFDLAPAAMSD